MSVIDLRAVLDAAKPDLVNFVSTAKDQFMKSFGSWVQHAHRERLEQIFIDAGKAKINVLLAATTQEAQEWDEVYQSLVDSIDTLGLDVKILGEIEARILIKSTLHQILSLIPVVAGAITKVALGTLVPGLGAILGPIAGTGVEYLLGKVFG